MRTEGHGYLRRGAFGSTSVVIGPSLSYWDVLYDELLYQMSWFAFIVIVPTLIKKGTKAASLFTL